MRIRVFALVISLFSASPVFAQGEAPPSTGVFWVLLAERADVGGDRVLLSDLGEIGGTDDALVERVKRIHVMDAPPADRTTILTPTRLEQILGAAKECKGAKFAIRGAAVCTITHETVRMSSAQLTYLAQGHLRRAIGPLRAREQLTISPAPQDLVIPAGRYTTRFEIKEPEGGLPFAGNFRLRVVAVVDGKPRVHRDVSVTLRRRAMVLVAAEDLRPNDAVTRSQVKLEEREIAYAAKGILQDPSAVDGHFPRRRMSKGQVLHRHDFRGPPIIFKNGHVDIVMKVGQMILDAKGVAMDDGALGETIRVRTGKKRRIVRGKILDSSTVEVKFQSRSGRR